MNTHVNFETAKLLKEKGFDLPIRTAWYLEDVAYWNYAKNHNESNVKFSAPTIAEVVMWLYEKYGIWVEVKKHTRNALRCFSPYIDNTPVKEDVFFNDYDSPTEAYQSAIQYCLKKII